MDPYTLIGKSLNNTISETDQEQLNLWLNLSPQNQQEYQAFLALTSTHTPIPTTITFHSIETSIQSESPFQHSKTILLILGFLLIALIPLITLVSDTPKPLVLQRESASTAAQSLSHHFNTTVVIDPDPSTAFTATFSSAVPVDQALSVLASSLHWKLTPSQIGYTLSPASDPQNLP